MAFDWSSITGNKKLMQFGGEALQDLGYGLTRSPTIGGAFGEATQRMAQMQPARDLADKQRAEEAKRAEMIAKYATTLRGWGGEYEDLAAGLEAGGLEPADAYVKAWERRYAPQGASDTLKSVGGHLYDTATGQWISPPSEAGNRQNVSLQGQWGRDEQGNPVYLQPSSTGEFVQARTPEGVTLASPFEINADRAAGRVYGTGVGGAQFDLPNAQLIADQTIAAINDVRNEKAGMAEHFGNVLGVPQQLTPAFPGSEKAQFQVAADRAINRAFLEGREMLKGGGQITDFESRKAEAAITAAQSAMEKGDQQQFLKALDDFEQAVRDGTAKLAGQASAMPAYSGAGNTGGGGRTLTYNPSTGRLE